MSIYSGFATRQAEQSYNKLVFRLISVVEQYIYDHIAINIDKPDQKLLQFCNKFVVVIQKLKVLQQRKYMEPKFSLATAKLYNKIRSHKILDIISISKPIDNQINITDDEIDKSFKRISYRSINKHPTIQPERIEKGVKHDKLRTHSNIAKSRRDSHYKSDVELEPCKPWINLNVSSSKIGRQQGWNEQSDNFLKRYNLIKNATNLKKRDTNTKVKPKEDFYVLS